MIIDSISDLHGHYPKLEGGDLLIIAGDFTKSDKLYQWVEFFSWLKKQSYKKKVLIGGNHDNFMFTGWPKSFEEAEELKEVREFLDIDDIDFEYLCDSGMEFEGLKIWGTPWSKTFKGMNLRCKAFTVDTEEELAEKWANIPVDVDILVTHSPPFGILDKTVHGETVGSKSLYIVLKSIKPKINIFGHVHESYGINDHHGIKCINASHVNEHYQPVNKPVRVIL